MAVITIRNYDEFRDKLQKLAGAEGDKITKKAVYEGAKIVADKIREKLEDNLQDPAYAGVDPAKKYGTKQKNPTGDLIESFGIAPIKQDKHGKTGTKIGFSGYDRKHVPNALKARAMESGTSTLKKRPFVRPAVKETEAKAIDKMGSVIDNGTQKILAL